jgi:hypothetical protein
MTKSDQTDSEVTITLSVRPGYPVAGLAGALLEAAMEWSDSHASPFTRCELAAFTPEGPKALSSVWSAPR